MIELLSDSELDVAIDTAHRTWLRLVRARARRRYKATISANPAILVNKYTPAVRAKMSASQKGRKRSPEARARVAEGIRAGHARRKALKALTA